jgi:amino-acid N-acetyltransferase
MPEVLPAAAQDMVAIRALLERSGLPTSDLDSARPDFVLIRENGQVIAAGALQRFGSSALLRSLVVAPDRRERGLGQAVVSELERVARMAHINQLILLTQTAAEFFAHQDYRVIARSSAPQDMQGSDEFRSLCPSSATCMAKSLKDFA